MSKQSCGCSTAKPTTQKQKTSTKIQPTTWSTGNTELKDHILARLGINRQNHTVTPGIYSLGNPNPNSPVFVTANYTVSFDALRSSLKNQDAYILVLDTMGVNVWCAAGKGTFGTEEIIDKIKTTGLADVVSHRKLILPQLGASGVNSFEVEKQSGFKVEYGPIRANDLPEYLKTGKATPEMRQVKYTLKDRAVLIPVELNAALLPLIVSVLVLYFLGGVYPAIAVATAVLGGTALFPLALPWLPTKDFSSKGFILGAVLALPFAAVAFLSAPASAMWLRVAEGLAYVLLMSPLTAYLALNFTGASTFTSRTGVKKEICRYIPAMVTSAVIGIVLATIVIGMHFFGGAI
ncbi:MAG: mercury methylation corrinoid protein HgcA [Candidatus Bathyarchaeota archaeon]|nr:mercury methylation corrinoid protein HgcA [Candidatus Bathyarchaeota archaeon]